jgi:hypothetical protein
MEVGLADTNWIEPIAGAVTVNVPVDDAERPVTEAVMVSTLAQPLSRYVVVATPLTVVTGVVMVALPLEIQGDVKFTVSGIEVTTPPTDAVTLTLVVPYAESTGV